LVTKLFHLNVIIQKNRSHILFLLNKIGIIFASIYNFLIPVDERLECFIEAIKNKNQLLFCDENLLITSEEDLEIVKKYYRFYY
jgi:hypothetical protein